MKVAWWATYQKEKKSWTSFLLVAELMFLTLTVLADMMVVGMLMWVVVLIELKLFEVTRVVVMRREKCERARKNCLCSRVVAGRSEGLMRCGARSGAGRARNV